MANWIGNERGVGVNCQNGTHFGIVKRNGAESERGRERALKRKGGLKGLSIFTDSVEITSIGKRRVVDIHPA
jgi:hypothetical protein